MSVNCIIKFDANPYGIYFAGQTISGSVELTLSKPKKVRGICLKISGYSKVNWKETKSNTTKEARPSKAILYDAREDYLCNFYYLVGSDIGLKLEIKGCAHLSWSEQKTRQVHGKTEHYTVWYTADEHYLKSMINLIGKSSSNPIDLLPGIHTYNFSTVLPQTLPTSFEGKYGHIRYTVRVCLERPWKFDQSYRVAFTVLKQVDLNQCPMLKIPTTVEEIKVFCCGPCKSSPLILTAETPVSGYVPGQAITVTVNVANNSRVDVEYIKIKLTKLIQYRSQSPTVKIKLDPTVIAERRCNGVKHHDIARYQENLLLPSVPPTDALFCKIIEIRYEIEIEAVISGMHANARLKIPITVGTIPLIYEYNPQFNINQGYNISTVGQGTATAPPVSPIAEVPFSAFDNTDMPPPTYEECIGGETKIEDEEDQHPIGFQSFTPRYPVYHFDNEQK